MKDPPPELLVAFAVPNAGKGELQMLDDAQRQIWRHNRTQSTASESQLVL